MVRKIDRTADMSAAVHLLRPEQQESQGQMTKADLSRPFLIFVCAAGTLHIVERGSRPPEGTLPVFSTRTREEAERLRVRHCRLASDGSGLYTLNVPPSDVTELGSVSEMFRKWYENLTASTRAL